LTIWFLDRLAVFQILRPEKGVGKAGPIDVSVRQLRRKTSVEDTEK